MTGVPAADWLFDLGNSRVKCAPLLDGALGETHAFDHDGARFAPGFEARLPARIGTAWVSSVAGAGAHAALLDVLAARCRRISLARTQAAMGGVRIAYADPARFGVDRFLALLAARARLPQGALVVGVGTALTIDLLDADGVHRGGRIAPSPTLMRSALQARAAQLPATGGDYVAFAADTADALASGCEGAALGLVDGSLAAAALLVGAPPALLLHGGGAPALLDRLPQARHAPALVLEGLLQWRAAATR